MKQPIIQNKKKLGRRGFTLVEVIVAIALVGIVSATAVVIATGSNQVYDDTVQRNRARVLADNALSAFQLSDTHDGFIAALRLITEGSSDDPGSGSGSGSDPISFAASTLKRYTANNFSFAYVLRDGSELSLCDAAGTVIASLDYGSASAATQAAQANSRLTLNFNKEAIITDMAYESVTSGGETDGRLFATSSSVTPGTYNIVLKLDTTPIVTQSGSGWSASYSVTGELTGLTLYYNQSENVFYGREGSTWYKYTFGSYKHSNRNYYPGFVKEAANITKLPAGCEYAAGDRASVMDACKNLISGKFNANSDSEIAYTDSAEKYTCSGSGHYVGVKFIASSKKQQLVDDAGQPILEKTFSSQNSFVQEIAVYNTDDEYAEDLHNTYVYTYTDSVNADVTEQVQDTEQKTATFTATVSTTTVSRKTYYRVTIKNSDGSTFYTDATNYASEKAALDAVPGRIKAQLENNGAKNVTVEKKTTYTIAKSAVTGSGSGTLEITVGTNQLTCQSGGRTYYCAETYSNRTYSQSWGTSRKTLSDPSQTLERMVEKGAVSEEVSYEASYEILKFEDHSFTVTVTGTGSSWSVTTKEGNTTVAEASATGKATEAEAKKVAEDYFTRESYALTWPAGTEGYTITTGGKTYDIKLDNNKLYYQTASGSRSSYTYYNGSSWRTATRTSSIAQCTNRNTVLSNFVKDGTLTKTVTYSFTCTKPVMKDVTVQKTYSFPVTVTASYEDLSIRTVCDTANVTEGGTKVTDLPDAAKTQIEAKNASQTYADESAFISAQRALNAQSWTKAPTGTYGFSPSHEFASLVVTKPDYMAEGGVVSFLDQKGTPLYSITIYTDEGLEGARELIGGKFASFYKAYRHYDPAKSSISDKLPDAFDFEYDDSTRTIHDVTNDRYLDYTPEFKIIIVLREESYDWSDTPVSISSSYYSEVKNNVMNASSLADGTYSYTGESGTLSAVADEDCMVYFYVDYVPAGDNTPIFRWQYDAAEFEEVAGGYFGDDDSYVENFTDGDGLYTCTLSDYIVEIRISFSDKRFYAEVKDTEGKSYYDLNYKKG